MNALQLSLALKKRYGNFVQMVSHLSNEQFMFQPTGKWTAGQHADHLVRSVKPVLLAIRIPAFLLRVLFRKANRPSKSYEDLVAKYKSKLENGGRASGRFVPAPVQSSQRSAKLKALYNVASRLATVVEHISEEKLDNCILPHPLLGKLTLREMLYFTVYHAAHHEANVKRDLGLLK